MPLPEVQEVVVRRGQATDAAPLASFAARTFAETFAHSTSEEDMRAHLDRSYGVVHQGGELADPTMATFLMLEGDAIVAFAQVRPNRPGIVLDAEEPMIELYRFYVDARWHGRGLAARLLTEVHRAAREFGGRTLWLSVWEGNARAMAYYRKEGFLDRGRIDFWLGGDRQTDCVFACPVRAG